MKSRTIANVKTLSRACLTVFLGATLGFTHADADAVDDRIAEIHHELLDAEIEAVRHSLASVRELASGLVKSGDPRKGDVLERERDLERRLGRLEAQRNNPDLRRLEKEFEAIDDRGGWWWLEEKNPVEGGPWYRLDRSNKRFTHWVKDPTGKPAEYKAYSATYEIIGLDDDDRNITLIEMAYPSKGSEPGTRDTFRFDRKTGVIRTPYGYFGQPKNGR